MGYRGSRPPHASAYKKSGHAVEDEFAELIDGSTDGLPKGGKTDVVGPRSETYSVKSGKKHWQLFLYGLDRLSTDKNFLDLAALGFDLAKSLQCFPADRVKYFDDKAAIKLRHRALIEDHKKGSDGYWSALHGEFPDNSYLNSKVSLKAHNAEILIEIQKPKVKSDFLRLAMFNKDEVGYLVIKNEEDFHLFKANEVVACLVEKTTVQLSTTGGHKNDLSVEGQKLLFRTDKNLLELEVRNDGSSYRRLKLNAEIQECFRLLDDEFSTSESRGQIHVRSRPRKRAFPTPKDLFGCSL